MIIQCESCSRKFIVKNENIPKEGRMVQCGYCSSSWHQMPSVQKTESPTKKIVSKTKINSDESLSVDKIKASDGKTYKFLGSQWAELLPSGKTGLFAKRKIGKELDKLTGRKEKDISTKKTKKVQKKLDPSAGGLNNEKESINFDKSKQGLGFFGYIFLFIIIGFSIIGILKTFETDLMEYFPEMEYIFEILDEQLIYLSETVKNVITIINDLINSY